MYNRINPNTANAWTPSDFDYFKNINGGWGYDHLEVAWQNPYTIAHNLSVTGGGDKITYFVGGSYTKQGAFMKNLTYDNYNLRTNITADLTKNLNLFAGLTINNNLSHSPARSLIGDVPYIYKLQLSIQPEWPVWTDGGNPIDYGEYGNEGAEVRGDGGYNTSNSVKPIINLKATYKIPVVPGLSASLQFNKSYSNIRKKQFQKRYDVWRMKTLGSNRQISTNDADVLSIRKSAQISKDYIQEGYNWANDYQVDFQINYERTFAGHHINSWVLFEQAGSNDGGILAGRETFPVYTTDQWWAASGDRANDYASGGTTTKYARQGYVAQLFYDYKQKYLGSFSCRYDGSPNFPKERRWGLFPSASLGWVISKEKFFKVKAIDFLKLRVSSGITSIDNIPGWEWQESYKVSGKSAYFGTNTDTYAGITYGVIPNPNVTWEKTLSSNVGFDINFLKHFNATAEYYAVRTYDILGPRNASVPATFTRSLPFSNYGEMRANGVDFSLGYRNHTGALNWYANVNMNYGVSRYTVRDEYVIYPWQKTLGTSTTRIVERVCTGMIRTQADLEAFKLANPKYTYYGIAPALGQLTYEDLSGPGDKPDGKVDEWDKKTLYKNNNPLVMGINLGITWKNFSVDITFNGNLLQKRYMDDLAATEEELRAWKKWHTDGWTPENTNASLPKRYSANDAMKRVTNDKSTFWLKNGDFLRMKLLNVGYSIPEYVCKKIGISGFKLYFSGTNLFLISKFNDLYYDPELPNGVGYPVNKTFNFGINVSL